MVTGAPRFPSSVREIDGWEGGVGWIAHPEERLQRASHALLTEDGVWLLDPVDYSGLDDLLGELGELAGICILLDRHERDAAAIARRHDVPVHLPKWMDGVATHLDVAVERLDGTVGTYSVRRLYDNPVWQEAALHDGETLYTPETFGTIPEFYRARGERVGLHPAVRLLPPRDLADLSVDRLLVGHGAGVFDDPEAAIRDALANARRRAPGVYFAILREFLT